MARETRSALTPWHIIMPTWSEGGASSGTRGEMRLITRKASLVDVYLLASPVDPNCKVCHAFHIKVMCNTGCGNTANHVAHTQEQNLPLWVWAVRSMPEIAPPRRRSPRKLAGEQNVCSLCRPQTPPCP